MKREEARKLIEVFSSKIDVYGYIYSSDYFDKYIFTIHGKKFEVILSLDNGEILAEDVALLIHSLIVKSWKKKRGGLSVLRAAFRLK